MAKGKEIQIDVTPVFTKIQQNFNFDYKTSEPKRIFILEGSSGSSKTTSILQIFIAYCVKNANKRKKITCARAKYSWCKDSILKDFIEMLIKYGLYDEKLHSRTHPQSYTLYGNEISFIGLDDPARFHGPRQDITYINEAMEADEDSYRQLEMRTNEAMILDFNPSYTQHWIFNTLLMNLSNKPYTFYSHSTFRNNPYLPKGQRDTILSYEPTPENIKNGTASEYKWLVYGLGRRAAQKGTIFKYITWIDKFPENVNYWFGCDYGYTVDPFALVKVYIEGNNIYLEKIIYEPIDTPTAVADALFNSGVSKHDIIASDSADRYNDREFNKELKSMGWNVVPISKTQGVSYWLGQLAKYKIHIVNSIEFRIEAENYKWREVNGIQINEPIDKFNHCFSANTQISTSIGLRNIIDVKIGDYVLTRNGYKKVLNSFCNGCFEIFDYEIDFGCICITVSCTSNHKFLTKKGWKQISKIEKSDTMYLDRYFVEKHITYIQEKNIIQKELKGYTGLFGNFIMVKYLRGLMFIIKMKTQKIIPLKILNLLKKRSISLVTLRKECWKTQSGLKDFGMQELKHQKNGTSQKKEFCGIKNTQRKKDLANTHTAIKNAWYVILSLLQKLKHKDSAPTDASLSIEEISKKMKNQDCVYFVGKNIEQTNIANQPVAVEVVVKNIASKSLGITTVYDLTIEDKHEFFANGLLAHNCWDAARYAIMLNSKKRRSRVWGQQ